MTNGDVVVHSIKNICKVKKNDKQIVFTQKQQQVTFRCRAVVLANGGHQGLYPSFFKDFPFLKQNRQNLVLSGQFLRQDTFKALMQRIKANGYKNIVIVGGSHSGFSCAWMLLHGPATYNRNNS